MPVAWQKSVTNFTGVLKKAREKVAIMLTELGQMLVFDTSATKKVDLDECEMRHEAALHAGETGFSRTRHKPDFLKHFLRTSAKKVLKLFPKMRKLKLYAYEACVKRPFWHRVE